MLIGLLTKTIFSSSYINSKDFELELNKSSSTIKIFTSSPVCRITFSLTFTLLILMSFS